MSDELTPGVYVEEFPSGIKEIVGVSTDRAAFIGRALLGPVDEPVTIISFGDFERLFGGLWLESYLGYAVRDFFLNGGSQAIIVRLVHRGSGSSEQLPKVVSSRSRIKEASIVALPLTPDDFIGPGQEESRQGLYALEKVDYFNLLNIPPYNGDADADPGLMTAAAAYCEKRLAFLVIDPPSQWQIGTNFEQGIEDIGTRSKNAAVYFPRLVQQNPRAQNGLKLKALSPGGAVAGVLARTEVWVSPAGHRASIRGYQSLAWKDADVAKIEDKLNILGINCLRSFPGQGVKIWGARTLAQDAEWKYIAVRRLALYIEQSLYRGTQWVVFESNDKALWTMISRQVTNFLLGLWRNGALMGQTPNDAFFVKCGRETTIQEEIDLGRVNLEIGFAPIKPAEFVILKLAMQVGQPQP